MPRAAPASTPACSAWSFSPPFSWPTPPPPRTAASLQPLPLGAQFLVAAPPRPQDWWQPHCGGAPFDAILLDAPCSASGIVRRHPDVRWLRRATDIAPLAALQARLLRALWPL